MAKRKTQEEFDTEVYELAGDDYTFLEPYTSARTRMKIRHNVCDYEYKIAPSHFLSGRTCPECSKKVTKRKFKGIVEELVGDEYTFLDDYVNGKTKMRVRHNNEGCNFYEWEVLPHTFIGSESKMGTRCPRCRGGASKSHEEFLEDVYKIYGDEYVVTGKYINSSTKISIIHKKCMMEYKALPSNLLVGKGCRSCSGHMKKTNEEFLIEVSSQVHEEYEFLEEYIGTGVPIKCRHNKCGHEYSVTPKDFLKGRRCRKCAGNLPKTTRGFKKEVFNMVGDDYYVVGEYIGANEEILMNHSDCNTTYRTTPSRFINGSVCPICYTGMSRGEIKIRDILDERGYLFNPEYRFYDCRDTNPLPFDFAILSDDREVEMLIEYDGIQHFEPVRFGGISIEEAEFDFGVTQKHDLIKSRYAEENGIPLLRIPYWEFDDVERIVIDFIEG